MSNIRSLPTSLLDIVSDIIKEDNESDAVYNRLLDIYGVISPFELSEATQYEFAVIAKTLVGEDFSAVKRLEKKIGTPRDPKAVTEAVGKKITKLLSVLSEAPSRKDFKMVADLIKAHPDQDKRNELASHHAAIFKKQNPRFDHVRFADSAGASKISVKEEPEQADEAYVDRSKIKPAYFNSPEVQAAAAKKKKEDKMFASGKREINSLKKSGK